MEAPEVVLLMVTDCAEPYAPAGGRNVGAATVEDVMLKLTLVVASAETAIPFCVEGRNPVAVAVAEYGLPVGTPISE
jgi:hypothetical protein